MLILLALVLGAAGCGEDDTGFRPLDQKIVLRPEAVAFAATPVGSTTTATVSVQNAGSAALVLAWDPVGATTGPFSIQVPRRELAALDDMIATITFRPATSGRFEERLELRAEPPGGEFVLPAPPVKLTMLGEGR